MCTSKARLLPVVLTSVRAVALAALLTLSACSSDPVRVPKTSLSPDEAQACSAFIAALPDTLSGQVRREVSPATALARAWGNEKPLVVGCREDMPQDFSDHSGCEVIGGIGWFTSDAQLKDPTVTAEVSSIGVTPVVTVSLPSAYRGDAAGVLLAVATAIQAELTIGAPCV